MKIIRLEASNVKRIKAVEIEPDGSMIVIGGKNAQGKSSVLDSIMVALGGKRYEDQKMVREGMKKGYIELDLGDYHVRRTFTEAGGGLLTVTGKDGVKLMSPQTILDSIIGSVSFDPLSFASADDKKQGEIIKDLAGLDLTSYMTDKQEAYDERTLVNRETKRYEVELSNRPFDDSGDFSKPIVTTEIIERIRAAGVQNTEVNTINEYIDDSVKCTAENQEKITAASNDILKLQEDIKQLQGVMKDLHDDNKKITKTVEIEKKKAQKLKDKIEDIKVLDEQLSKAEDHNITHAANNNHLETKKKIAESEDKSKALTAKIIKIDADMASMIQKAPMPIGGLSFSPEGLLTYQDIPFSQASDAEKIRVSVSIGIAMNPKLKVLMIKNGSLLDEDNLRMIGKMAELTDAQLWVESVGEREGTSVIMEDGVSRVLGE